MSDKMFHQIPDAYAITCVKGVYRQVEVYKYKGRIFIKHGSGFAWLLKSGDTSVPNLRIDEIDVPFAQTYNQLGYMCVPGYEKRRG